MSNYSNEFLYNRTRTISKSNQCQKTDSNYVVHAGSDVFPAGRRCKEERTLLPTLTLLWCPNCKITIEHSGGKIIHVIRISTKANMTLAKRAIRVTDSSDEVLVHI